MFSLQRFFGKEDRFFELLEASAEEARASVQALSRFLKNPDQVRTLDEFILSRTKENRLFDEIGSALSTSFVTAIEREDIQALSLSLYRIPKTLEKIAERISICPHFLKGFDFARQVTMLEKATDTLLEMTQELRQGIHLERIKGHNDELQKIEGDADKLILELFQQLYSGEHEPLNVVFLKDLFELMEKVFDRCRDAGNVINHIVLKNS
jgi:uncharacterized protein Yka (UPF0111/DUF47 family)